MDDSTSTETELTATGSESDGRSDAVALRRRAVRGSVMSLVNQGIKTVVSLVTPLVLAAYLSPGDFGVVGTAVSIQSLFMILRDGGFANSLIQKKDATALDRDSVFWLSTALAAVLAGVLALFAASIARFYDEPRLAPILWLLPLPIVVQGLSSVQDAEFRKQLRFGRLLLADGGSMILASVVAIAAVMLGAGIWALVLRMILTPVLFGVACWSLSRWWPRREFSFDAIRSLWSFGSFLLLSSILVFGMNQLDVPIIGKLIGLGGAGIFFLARNLALTTVRQVSGAVARVMFPVFSVIQDDLPTIRSGYLTGTRCLATLVFPIIAALIALSPEAVPVLLGEQWLAAVSIIQVIALQGVVICVNSPASQILFARGRSRLQFVWSLFVAVAIITSFVVGCRWGILGVAVTWTVVRLSLAPVLLWFAAREIQMSVSTAVLNVARPALAALVAGAVARLTGWGWTSAGGAVGPLLLAAETMAGFAAFAIMSALLLKDTFRKIRNDLLATGWLGRLQHGELAS